MFTKVFRCYNYCVGEENTVHKIILCELSCVTIVFGSNLALESNYWKL
jgi:hypothetical protein